MSSQTEGTGNTIETGAMQRSRVMIIGGGAAGLTAAVTAARRGSEVTILEADARVGRKILASGNGRCNLTNTKVSRSAFNDPAFVEPVLRRHGCEPVLGFFAQLGLATRADEEGRVYPTTNTAASVLDVLRLECEHLGVEVRCGFEAARIAARPDGSFAVTSTEGVTVEADAVIVATGGGGALLAQTGHEMVGESPVLGPIRTEPQPIRGLSGVRVKCTATLHAAPDSDGTSGRLLATERGELLFRDYGVSGIMVFDLSRYLEPPCTMTLDFFPDHSDRELVTMLAARQTDLAWRTAETFFAGLLHDRVARAILRAANIANDAPAARLDPVGLTQLLKAFPLRVLGMGEARQSQVTRGGAATSGFDRSTMESQRIPGLFAAGEVLDIDGRSGGYNLHWAWASGIVAGEYAAQHVSHQSRPRDHKTQDAT